MFLFLNFWVSNSLPLLYIITTSTKSNKDNWLNTENSKALVRPFTKRKGIDVRGWDRASERSPLASKREAHILGMRERMPSAVCLSMSCLVTENPGLLSIGVISFLGLYLRRACLTLCCYSTVCQIWKVHDCLYSGK